MLLDPRCCVLTALHKQIFIVLPPLKPYFDPPQVFS